MEELYDALVDLKQSLDKHVACQEEANTIMRALIGALQENAQQVADLGQELSKRAS